MHEFPDPYDLDEDFFDPVPIIPARTGAPGTKPVQRPATVRPRAVLGDGADWRRQALARLLDAHEARLSRPAPAAEVTIATAREEPASAFSVPAPHPLEADGSPWGLPRQEDDFELWDELDRPPSRKSLRAMV